HRLPHLASSLANRTPTSVDHPCSVCKSAFPRVVEEAPYSSPKVGSRISRTRVARKDTFWLIEVLAPRRPAGAHCERNNSASASNAACPVVEEQLPRTTPRTKKLSGL